MDDGVDFAVAAYHDGGKWVVVELSPFLGEHIDELTDALGRFPSDVGVLGIVAMNDDFFVIVRRIGTQIRMMLSDITAVDDWPLAAAVAELLDLPDPEENAPQAAGDLDILSDLGMSSYDLGTMCDDDDLFPEDILLDVAERLGFGAQLEFIIG